MKPAAQAAALAPRSSRPHTSPRKLAEDRYHLIAETWLANQALGPRQVRNQLRRTHALRVGTSTVRRVLEEHDTLPLVAAPLASFRLAEGPRGREV